jgi:hypothetical protein
LDGQKPSTKVILVTNSVFTLGRLRTLAQNELDFHICHQELFEDEPISLTFTEERETFDGEPLCIH